MKELARQEAWEDLDPLLDGLDLDPGPLAWLDGLLDDPQARQPAYTAPLRPRLDGLGGSSGAEPLTPPTALVGRPFLCSASAQAALRGSVGVPPGSGERRLWQQPSQACHPDAAFQLSSGATTAVQYEAPSPDSVHLGPLPRRAAQSWQPGQCTAVAAGEYVQQTVQPLAQQGLPGPLHPREQLSAKQHQPQQPPPPQQQLVEPPPTAQQPVNRDQDLKAQSQRMALLLRYWQLRSAVLRQKQQAASVMPEPANQELQQLASSLQQPAPLPAQQWLEAAGSAESLLAGLGHRGPPLAREPPRDQPMCQAMASPAAGASFQDYAERSGSALLAARLQQPQPAPAPQPQGAGVAVPAYGRAGPRQSRPASPVSHQPSASCTELPAGRPAKRSCHQPASATSGPAATPYTRAPLAGQLPPLPLPPPLAPSGDWLECLSQRVAPAAQPSPCSTLGAPAACSGPPETAAAFGRPAGLPLTSQGSAEVQGRGGLQAQPAAGELAKVEAFKERERERARRSRQRKQERLKSLEANNAALRKEVGRLQQMLRLWATQGFVTSDQACEFLEQAPGQQSTEPASKGQA